MAQIQYSGLVEGMQGSLNGSVLSRGRSGQIIYSKPRQRKEPTAAQLGIRAGFAMAANLWRELTPEQRTDWGTIAEAFPLPDRFGTPRIVSGYAYFQRMTGLSFPILSGSPLVPNLTSETVYEFSPTDSEVSISLTDQGYEIDSITATADTINDSAVVNYWNLYISLPVPDFDLPYFKTWYQVGQGTLAANIGAAQEIEFSAAGKVMPKGFRSFPGAKHLIKAQAFLPNYGNVSVEEIWDNTPAWEPIVEFPTIELTYSSGMEGTCDWDGTEWFFIPWFIGTPFISTLATDYQCSLSFKAPQSGGATPDPTGWGPERLQDVAGPFESVKFATPGPFEDNINNELIQDGAPPPYSFGSDPHLPTRIRFYHTPSATYGPYNYLAAPIFFT